MKIVAYKVVEHMVNTGTRDMEDEVNQLIQAGWQPYGTMTAVYAGDTYYAQPMVKYEEVDNRSNRYLLPEEK